jgi:hypothetical protein
MREGLGLDRLQYLPASNTTCTGPKRGDTHSHRAAPRSTAQHALQQTSNVGTSGKHTPSLTQASISASPWWSLRRRGATNNTAHDHQHQHRKEGIAALSGGVEGRGGAYGGGSGVLAWDGAAEFSQTAELLGGVLLHIDEQQGTAVLWVQVRARVDASVWGCACLLWWVEAC